MPFFVDQKRDLAIAQIPRCANNSIGQWLGKDGIIVKNDDQRLLAVSRRIAFVREPIDRLESAFSLFYWMHDYDKKYNCLAPIDSWQNFVEYVLDPDTPEDEHWKPQCEHIEGLANRYIKLENLPMVFNEIRPGILSYCHKTSRSPLITNYKLAELMEKYINDLKLYKDAE